MPTIPQSEFIRPTSVTVFKRDPAGLGLAAAFLLSNTAAPSSARARFDLTENETETLTFDAIDEPMEQGIAATIATIKGPDVFVASGILTATPLDLFGVLGAFGSIVRRDLTEYQRFVALAEAREPVIVVARERAFPSMAIAQIVRTKAPGDGNSVRLQVTFRQTRIVLPAGVVELVDLNSLLMGASSSADAGTQGAANADGLPADVLAGGLG